MRKPISLGQDYDAVRLRWIARESGDADQVRRLLALAAKHLPNEPFTRISVHS